MKRNKVASIGGFWWFWSFQICWIFFLFAVQETTGVPTSVEAIFLCQLCAVFLDGRRIVDSNKPLPRCKLTHHSCGQWHLCESSLSVGNWFVIYDALWMLLASCGTYINSVYLMISCDRFWRTFHLPYHHPLHPGPMLISNILRLALAVRSLCVLILFCWAPSSSQSYLNCCFGIGAGLVICLFLPAAGLIQLCSGYTVFFPLLFSAQGFIARLFVMVGQV